MFCQKLWPIKKKTFYSFTSLNLILSCGGAGGWTAKSSLTLVADALSTPLLQSEVILLECMQCILLSLSSACVGQVLLSLVQED